MRKFALFFTFGCAVISHGQIVNGDFESGNLNGWTIASTVNGTTLVQNVVALDIDEAGPLGISNAARFAVGNAVAPNQGQQGIEFTQSVCLIAGAVYTFDMDWKAFRENSVTNNSEGGQFNLIVEGASIAFGAAGSTGATPKTGHLTGTFTAPATGVYSVGVRITRQFTVPLLSGVPTLYQAIDNFTMTPPAGLSHVNPNSFAILAGTPFGGTVASLAASDDDRVYVLNDESDSGATIEFTGNGGTSATGGCLTVETSATRTDLTEFTDVYNYSTSSWNNVVSRSTTLTDSRVTAVMTLNNVAGSGEVKARIRWIPQADLEAADGWSESVDLVDWQYL